MTTSDSHPSRDETLGAALTALRYEPTRDGFWSELDTRLAAHDDAERRQDGGDFEHRNGPHFRRRLLAIAAGVFLLTVAAAVAVDRFGNNGSVAVETVNDSDPSNPDADGALDDNESGEDKGVDTGEGDTGDDGKPAGADENSGVGSDQASPDGDFPGVDYTREPEVIPLPVGSAVRAGSPETDRLLLSIPVPGTDGAGCGGRGRLALVSQSLDGSEPFSAPDEIADYDLFIPNPYNPRQFLARGTCREDITPYRLATVADDGPIVLGPELEEPWDLVPGLTTWGMPNWSQVDNRIWFDATTDEAQSLAIHYDTLSGRLVETEVPGGRFLTELADRHYFLIEPESEIHRAIPSPDGRLAVVYGESPTVIVDKDFKTVLALPQIAGPESPEAAWTPSGVLIALTGRASFIAADPATGAVHEIEIPSEGDDEWRHVVVADGGKVVAVSKEPGPEGRALALIFDP